MIKRFLTAGMLAIMLAAGATPHASAATSYTLTIVSIECITKQDSGANGKDEPKIKVDLVKVYKGDGFANGTSKSVNEARTMGTSAVIDLWEVDTSFWDSDDFMGQVTVFSTKAGLGNQIAVFAGSGGLYEITYKIT
jgi:hypothetical protein